MKTLKCIGVALATALLTTSALAEPAVQLPGYVVFDTNGTVFGRYIGISGNNFYIAVDDPDNGNIVPITIYGNPGGSPDYSFQGPTNRVYYTNTNCQGTAYIDSPDASNSGYAYLTGFNYGIGPDVSSGNLTLFRASGAALVSQPTINSRATNGSCSNSTGGTGSLATTAAVIDIDATHPAPYSIGLQERVDLIIDADTGFIGAGTDAPESNFHSVVDDSGFPFGMNLENTNGSSNFIGFRLKNAGGSIDFNNSQQEFRINIVDGDTRELDLDAAGNLSIAGSLSQGSSRSIKSVLGELEGRSVLERLSELPLSRWSYHESPAEHHAGPMAEDFYALFGLGEDEKHISPGDMAGLSLAAIKELAAQNDQLRSEVESRNARIDALEQELSRLDAIEQQLRTLDQRLNSGQ